jgi:tRNA threonylcarbamoyladenosine biosynthesis protein TsaE
MPGIEDVVAADPAGDAAKTKSYVFETGCAEETVAVGREIAKLLAPPKFLILRGDLGAGKTTLVKGIAEGLDAAEAETRAVTLYHLDLYRIEGERQLESLGLEELAEPESIVLVEWGEKFPSVVKRSDGEIVVRSAGGDARKITVSLG